MPLYLGIDTSNYTTSLALADENGILCNLKAPVFVGDGERGVRQSDAVFSHVKNLPGLFEQLGHPSVSAVGVSAFPRDCEGSYMPCFLSGIAAASAFSTAADCPLYRFSHQAGHIAAAAYSAGHLELLKRDFIAFHVSGGTTECLLVRGIGSIEKIGGTLDLNAGQVIDRTGVRLGLKFPCGPALEALAQTWYQNGNPVPKVKVSVRGLECNLSGLENTASSFLEEGRSHEEIAAVVIESVRFTLEKILCGALERYGSLPVLFAGGVMSCRLIRDDFTRRFGAYFAEPAFSADNAAGIALLCRQRHNGDE